MDVVPTMLGKVIVLLEDARSRQFLILSAAFLVGLIASCYVEEWIFKALPGFDFPWAVALVELLCFAVSAAVQQWHAGGLAAVAAQRKAPLSLYFMTALCLALSQSFGKVVLRYLNYATSTILKSAKLVPTLLLSVLWLGRHVGPAEWGAAALLVISSALMALGERSLNLNFNPLGLAYAAANLFFAALQGNLQERILKDHNASISEALLFTNGLGVLVVLVAMVANGELRPAFMYFAASPHALTLLLVRSITFLAGAVAFNKLIKEYGTGASTAVGTARKSLTVLLSFLLYPKPFHINYVFGIATFLAADLVYLHLNARRAERRKAETSPPIRSPREDDECGGCVTPSEEEELQHTVKVQKLGASELEMEPV